MREAAIVSTARTGIGKAYRGYFNATEAPVLAGHVMDAAVGDQEGAGDPIRRHIGERRAQRREQSRPVSLAVGDAGFHHPHVEIGNAAEPLVQRSPRFLGLFGALAKILARALVDHDGCDRRQRLAVLAGEGGVGERQQYQRQRGDAHRSPSGAAEQQQYGDHDDRGERDPQHERRNQGGERDAVLHAIAPAARAGQAYGPGRPCSCRSAYTSRC